MGRVATAASARGTGLGCALVIEGIAEAGRRFGATPIRIGAQPRSEAFYAGLGVARTGDDCAEGGIAPCTMMRG